jgi:formate/nitrite transporter FocA (FNT family)
MLHKLLTRKGWRVVAHSMLAAAGIGLLYLLSKMVIGDIQQENTLSWPLLGAGMTFSLWLVALGSMLLKAELADWR